MPRDTIREFAEKPVKHPDRTDEDRKDEVKLTGSEAAGHGRIWYRDTP
jgi:hypothetical protein